MVSTIRDPNQATADPTTVSTPSTLQRLNDLTASTERIGHYKLLQRIGEGGFGVVYLAEQEQPVKRRVALKVIKLGMDTRQVIARFEAERQALALMDHPNIAKVLDGGATDAGRPYFVMELVKGIKITQYCDQNRVGLKERLDLFLQVCHAIQHAHQKGIIHRDIKPSNILVTMHDGAPVPKVIDFGIAKATEQRLTDKTLFTAYDQFMGTPAYMSPEQAETSVLDIDTRSDIYSLGVLLYELLTGRTPFENEELLQRGIEEARRAIREEEPPRPSTKLTELVAADVRRLTSKSEIQQSEKDRASLRRLLQERKDKINFVRGDLDWIVMKCLEKDRTRRYETANGLAMDVKRFLNQEPITARPPSNIYRFQKLVRRNKAAFAAAAMVVAALVLGLAGVSWQWRRANTNRALAEDRLYVSDMNLAGQAVEDRNFGTAQELLQRHRHRARERLGWEWRYLWRRSRGDQVATLRGHTTRVRSVFFSSDARSLVTHSQDKVLMVWNLATRRAEQVITNISVTVGFMPDGSTLLVQRTDGWIGTCAAQTGQFQPLLQETNILRTLLPDGQTVLVAGPPGDRPAPVLLRNLFTRASGFSVPAERCPIYSNVRGSEEGNFISVSPDGGKLAVLQNRTDTTNGLVDVWETSSSRLLAALPLSDPVVRVGFGSGNRLAVSGAGGRVTMWKLGLDLATKTDSLVLQAHESWVHAVAFSSDGQTLATASSDATIKLWDTGTAKLLETFQGHLGPVECLSFSADDKWLATGGRDTTVRLWMPGQRRAPERIPGTHPIETFAVSMDGRLLAGGIYTGSPTGSLVKVWELPTFRELATLTNAGDVVMFSRDGLSLTTLGDTFKQWNLSNGSLERTFPGPANCDLSRGYLCHTSRDERLVLVDTHGTNFLFDAAGLEPILTFPVWPAHRGKTRTSVFTADNRVVITASDDGTLHFYDLGEKRTLEVRRVSHEFLSRPVVSPDGTSLAVGAGNTLIYVWDLRTRTPLWTLRGHRQTPGIFGFTPDGRRMVTSSGDDIKLWDVALRQVVLTLPYRGREEAIPDLRGGLFLSGGDMLLAWDDGGNFASWRAATWEEIESAEKQEAAR
ncbi:MAG: protein kinase [Verrucomicrobia subdivision 3 bacterium]|nr:protein kinase [Limisphaerales bacterium]